MVASSSRTPNPPVVHLFFWGGTIGGMGVLLLIFVTSIAVGVFFARNPSGETAWRRSVAPWLATVALAIVIYYGLKNFATLLGVEEDHPLRWGVPIVYGVVAVLGIIWGLVLRSTRPNVYSTIGLGARSVTVTAVTGAHEAVRR